MLFLYCSVVLLSAMVDLCRTYQRLIGADGRSDVQPPYCSLAGGPHVHIASPPVCCVLCCCLWCAVAQRALSIGELCCGALVFVCWDAP